MRKMLLVASIFFAFQMVSKSQEEQIYKPLILQLKEGKDTVSYVMDSYSYSVNKYYKDSTGCVVSTLQLSASLQTNPDDVLIEWLTVKGSTKNVTILCRKVKTGEVYRTFVLKDATVISWNESMSEYIMNTTEKSTIYLEIVPKEFSIDNYPLKEIKSPYEDF